MTSGGANPGFARGRRLRSTPAMRRWTAQTRLAPADFVLPVFVKQDLAEPVIRAAHPIGIGKAMALEPNCAEVAGLVDLLPPHRAGRAVEGAVAVRVPKRLTLGARGPAVNP